jgi:hypothetical protein
MVGERGEGGGAFPGSKPSGAICKRVSLLQQSLQYRVDFLMKEILSTLSPQDVLSFSFKQSYVCSTTLLEKNMLSLDFLNLKIHKGDKRLV